MTKRKYKVWCKNRGGWEKDKTALLPNGSLIGLKTGKPLNLKTHKVLFFLGSQDKNGKEILEDDIIQFPNELIGATKGSTRVGFIAYNERDMEYYIYFNLDKVSYTGTLAIMSGNEINGEVIGNVNKNPDLIKE